MIYVDSIGNIIENSSVDFSSIKSIDFNINQKYNKINPALKINFTNNISNDVKYIKKLLSFQKLHIDFITECNGFKIKYILSNCNDDILTAIKATFINNINDRYLYLYDNIFNSLDALWKKYNPCKFCNDVCIASKNHKAAHKENGCCYSFDYSKNMFKFIDNVKVCKYLGKDKRCTTENISCKFFVCNYLKKNNIFNINMKDYLLVQAFFNNKQKLILKYNFFRSKEEILEKLMEKNNTPFFIYYLYNDYRISKNQK